MSIRCLLLSLCLYVCSSLCMGQDFFGGMAPADVKAKTSKSSSKPRPKVSKPDKPNKVDAQGRKQGEWAVKYETGYYKYVATFKDDVPVGKIVRYDENGHKTVEMITGDDDTCRVVTFHDNGKKESVGQYFDKKREGLWKFYDYNSGHLVMVSCYHNGIRHGVESLFYADGKLLEMTIWVNGRKHGPWGRFYPNGKKWAEAEFVNGEYDGDFTIWGPNLKVATKGQFRKGVKVGKWHVVRTEEPLVSYDIVYDNNGVVANQAELDSISTIVMKHHESMAGKLKDPADYFANPEEYLGGGHAGYGY